jgi:hypothetical protein
LTTFDSESTFDFEVKSTFSEAADCCAKSTTRHTILMPRWAHADTARIGELIELEGVIDVNNPLHHTVDFIKKVRRDHFPQFTEKNFRTNYRNKVREYEFGDVELKGAR